MIKLKKEKPLHFSVFVYHILYNFAPDFNINKV